LYAVSDDDNAGGPERLQLLWAGLRYVLQFHAKPRDAGIEADEVRAAAERTHELPRKAVGPGAAHRRRRFALRSRVDLRRWVTGQRVRLARTFLDVYGLDQGLRYFLSGLDSASYLALLRRAIVGSQDPENVILMEIDPLHQKTLPDFLLTEKLLGIKTVDIRAIKKEGNRLYWESEGRRMPIRRIYNRAIVDELERKGAQLAFDLRDDLEVEWAGHPNWYFRISKYSIPYLKHASVPKTWFLDQMERVPENLESYALKPLYSFAGLGVVIAPKKADIAAVPVERRSQYILQERLHFEPVIETPFGGTKVEVRMMYIWVDEVTPVLTILRMGRGLMMGVDHNRDMEWVGSSAGLF